MCCCHKPPSGALQSDLGLRDHIRVGTTFDFDTSAQESIISHRRHSHDNGDDAIDSFMQFVPLPHLKTSRPIAHYQPIRADSVALTSVTPRHWLVEENISTQTHKMALNCGSRPFNALVVVWSSLLLTAAVTTTSAFVMQPPNRAMASVAIIRSASAASTTSEDQQQRYQCSSIFDFTNPAAVDNFERIDDVIMGGISTSTIRSSSSESYASWSGVCRTDGGGFCGARTRTFEKGPLQVPPDATGFYLKARLASDDEPERRVWKLSTRTEESRGEELFQAEFKIPSKKNQQEETDWSLIQVPFQRFKRVRGARFVPDGSKMDVSNGIYQIGMTMSKFVMAENMTAIENFRDGYFELQVKEIGFVLSKEKNDSVVNIPTPKTLPEKEVKRRRPLLLKMLIPIAKVFFFSEQSQRRKSAMKILREKRGMSSRASAIWFGINVRRGSKKTNLVASILQASKIVGMDAFRSVFSSILRYGLFYPLRLVSRLAKALKKGKQASPNKLATNTS